MDFICQNCGCHFSTDDSPDAGTTDADCPTCHASVQSEQNSVSLELDTASTTLSSATAPSFEEWEKERAQKQTGDVGLSLSDQSLTKNEVQSSPLKAPEASSSNEKKTQDINETSQTDSEPSETTSILADKKQKKISPKLSPNDSVDKTRTKTQPRITPTGIPVVFSNQGASPWRLYAMVVGTAVFAILIVIVSTMLKNKAPPPPKMPNPLRQVLGEWKEKLKDQHITSIEAGLRQTRSALQRCTDQSQRNALRFVQSALIRDEDSAPAIALYAYVLAHWPDRLDNEEVDRAMGAIVSAVGDDPESVFRSDLEEARAWLYIRKEKMEAARKAINIAQTRNPDEIRYRIAYAATRLKAQPEEAIQTLKSIQKHGAKLCYYNLWFGEAYLRTGQIKKALQIWEGAVQNTAKDVFVLRRLARLAAMTGFYDESIRRFEQIVQAGWASVEDRLLLARILYRVKRKLKPALTVLDEGLTAPDLSHLNRSRLITEKASVVEFSLGKILPLEEVSRWLDDALAQTPDLPELLYVAGLLDLRMGAKDTALESWEAATEIASDHPEIGFRTALLLGEENFDEAKQVVQSTLREAPQYVPLYLLQAWLTLVEGNTVYALDSIRRALDFDPERYSQQFVLSPYLDSPTMYIQLGKKLGQIAKKGNNPIITTASGIAYYLGRQFKRAQKIFLAAIHIDQYETSARLYQAILALNQGKFAFAQKNINIALETDSQHRLVRLYQARLFERSRRYNHAEKIYQDLLDKNPLDSTAQIGLAQALIQLGKDQIGKVQLQKILQNRPDDPTTLRFLVQHAKWPYTKKPAKKVKGRGKRKKRGK